MSDPSPRLAPLALLALASCAPAAVRPPPSAIEITVAPGEGPPVAPPPADPTPPPQSDAEVLASPLPIACEIHGQRVFSPFEEPITICLGTPGVCFAKSAVRSEATKLTLRFAEGAARRAGVQVELDDGRVAVRGVASPEKVKLYPRLLFTIGSPTSSGDFVVPMGRVLEVESAARGTLTAALALDADIAVAGGVVRAERRCDEVSLSPSRFGMEEARRFVAGKPVKPAKAGDMLPLHRETPLSTAPGLPPVAVLRPLDEQQADVDVIERRGRAARIFWARGGYAVYGWVPSAALKRSSSANVLGMLGGAPGGPIPRAGGKPFACDTELTLVVEVAGRRVEVGKIRRNTRLFPGARRDGFVILDRLDGPATLEEGAAWLVREAEFTKACAPSG